MTKDPSNSTMRHLARNSILNLVQQVWTLGVGIATSVFVTRGLGIEDRGGYAILLLFISLIFTFINSGLEPAIVYFTAKGDYTFLKIVRASVALTAWASIIAIIVSLIMVFIGRAALFPNIDTQSLLIAIIVLPCVLFANSLQVIFRGLEDFRTFNILEMIAQFTLMIMSLILVWGLHLGIMGAFVAMFVRYGFTITASTLLLRQKVERAPIFTITLDLETLREFVSYGARAYVFYIVAFLNQRLDVLLLNLFLVGKSSIAVYDVAVGIGEKLWLVSRSVSLVIFSRVASMEKSDQSRNIITPIAARHVLWLSVLAAAIIYLLADWGIQFLYGSEYALSAIALKLLLPGLVMLGVGQIVSNDLAGRGKPETVAKQSIVGMIINVMLNIVLIPQLNFLGSAIASAISYTAITILYLYTFHKNTGIALRDLILPTYEDTRLWIKCMSWLRGKIQSSFP